MIIIIQIIIIYILNNDNNNSNKLYELKRSETYLILIPKS